MESFLQDLRYAARMLWKTKGVSAVAIISLAAGIGANAAIYSLVNSVLLRPRPVANPEELVQLYIGYEQQPYQTISPPAYRDFREKSDVFTGLAAFGIWQFRLGLADEVQQVWGEPVSGNYFDVLGIKSQLGRTFVAEEDSVPSRNPVVVLSHSLWQRQFAGDSQIVGKTIRLNGNPLTVIGIAPAEFTGMMGGMASELWVPTMIMPLLEPARGEAIVTSRGNSWLTMVGRLKPTSNIEQARAQFDGLTAAMRELHPRTFRRDDGRAMTISILPERDTRVGPGMRAGVYGAAALLFVIVTLVLFVACVNLVGVLFARSVARRAEISMRLALGASRSRLMRQLLTESVLLALVAGVVGVVVAITALKLLVAFMPALPEGIRVAIDLQVDWRVVLFALVFSAVTGVLFGLGPALSSSRVELASILRDDAGSTAGSRRIARARRGLIVAQVACSLTLLIGAGLVLRSLEKVRPTQLGFRSNNFVVAPVELDEARYDGVQGRLFFEQLGERLAQSPGVTSVSFVSEIQGGFMGRARSGTTIEGYAAVPDEELEMDANVVGPGYFTNMKVPIVEGRDFDSRDRVGAACVAIVNEAFTQRYFPGAASALGKRITGFSAGPNTPRPMCAIVGVVRDDAWQSLLEAPRPFFSLPLLQSNHIRTTVLVETTGDPALLSNTVRQAIRQLDPDLATNSVQTLRAYFSVMAFPFRMLGFVLGACGALALLLAAVGIYGVVAHSVARRRREVGIRIALGALPRDILRLVVSDGMAPVAYGIIAGVALGGALAQVLSSGVLDTGLLFGVKATDVLTFAGVTMLLASVALVACYVPARGAARADPLVSLRNG